MKNFNIFWVHFFRGGGCLQKTNAEGGDYLRGGGAWQERKGNVFEGKG